MERPNRAILNQAVTTGALPSPHRAHPPAQRVRSRAPLQTFNRAPMVCYPVLLAFYGDDPDWRNPRLRCAFALTGSPVIRADETQRNRIVN